MDGRFLSQPDVIQASRSFICVRMMTYESASEAEVLKTLWRPGAPLENTIFAILDPDGHSIVRGGRSPQMVFRDSADMAMRMNEISRYYNSNGKSPPSELPAVDTVRLAVDVAACDKRPLAIVVGRNDQERKLLAGKLAPIAWSDQMIGKLVYTTSSGYDLGTIKNAGRASGYVFVAPNLLGTDGTALIQLSAAASPAELAAASRQAIRMYRPQMLDHHDHVHLGRQQGVQWQTAIPVTDPHAIMAQQEGLRPGGGPGGGPGNGPGGWPQGGAGQRPVYPQEAGRQVYLTSSPP